MAAFRCPGGWNKASGIHGWERTLGRRVFICYCGKAVRQGEGKEGKKVVKEEDYDDGEEMEKAARFCRA